MVWRSTIVLVMILWSAAARAQGPVMLVGIDTEFGFRPGNNSHGTIATWATVLNNGLLSNVTNGNNGILVLGGGKNPADMMTSFWTQVAVALGRPVTFAPGPAAIQLANFGSFAMIAVVNAVDGSGRLTQAELDALNARTADLSAFICGGGAVFVSVQLLANAYQFLPGAPTTVVANVYGNIAPTATGAAMGITATNLDNGPWHGVFTAFPSYLTVLATNVPGGQVAAIGGANIQPAVPSFSLPGELCHSGSIVADGAATVNEANHFWSVQESDASWNRYGTEAMDWFPGAAGPRDLRAFAEQRGVRLKCNTYYRVKLAVVGLCSGWNETSKLLFLRCPPVDAGPDRCCNGPTGAVQLGAAPSPGVTSQWSPSAGLTNATVSNPLFLPYAGFTQPATYTVTNTDAAGCQASDSMQLFCGRPTVSLSCGGEVCRPALTARPVNAQNLTWSTGATTPEITVNSNGSYAAAVANACGSTDLATTVDSIAVGDFPTLILPSAFTPNGDGNNDVFKIFHLGKAEGEKPAYNATGYALYVFDRWGGEHLVAREELQGCQSLWNGQIGWDGNLSGSPQPSGVYSWRLELKNCSRGWTSQLTRRNRRYVCTRRSWSIWCFCTRCVEGYWEEYDEGFNTGSVTLVR